jgi:hypothetical protein
LIAGKSRGRKFGDIDFEEDDDEDDEDYEGEDQLYEQPYFQGDENEKTREKLKVHST